VVRCNHEESYSSLEKDNDGRSSIRRLGATTITIDPSNGCSFSGASGFTLTVTPANFTEIPLPSLPLTPGAQTTLLFNWKLGVAF
jgi:hypothetical protein